MKTILITTLALISSPAFAAQEVSSKNLICLYDSYYSQHIALSCVSKASIQRDELEIEVLKLQKEKLELEVSQKKKSKK